MGNKKLLLVCTFLLCMMLARTGTANAAISTVSVDPSIKEVQPNENFTIAINITNSPDQTQYIIENITWDPDVLELQTGTDADVEKGDFLNGEIWLVTLGLDPGRIAQITEAKLSGTKSGSGTLFTIKFHSKVVEPVKVSPVNIGFAELLNGLDIADFPDTENGTVTVIPEFPVTLLLPFFLTATAIAFIAKTILSRKRQNIKIP